MPCQIFSISMYRGATPLNLEPIPSVAHPILTGKSVTDVAAEFVADPFMVKHDGVWYMFFEVMDSRTSRGSIGLATSHDGLSWTYRQIVLDEPFHLSYPYVVQSGGEYFMIPETQRNSAVRLYRADPFPWRWRFVRPILDLAVADNSLIRWEDRWWMLASQFNRNLRLFHAGELEGPWQEHAGSPVVVKDRSDGVRPAGRLTPWNGGFLRYAQDCEVAYGTQVRPALITSLSTTHYSEEEMGPAILGPGNTEQAWNGGGMHHVDPHQLAADDWLACVDGWFWEGCESDTVPSASAMPPLPNRTL
ncbi:MAG TPA: hypothetical protein VKU19_36440 [Bryobacteraceae bacterium]|nr:hypothetical protein [Bryobacteraceae bacterium]